MTEALNLNAWREQIRAILEHIPPKGSRVCDFCGKQCKSASTLTSHRRSNKCEGWLFWRWLENKMTPPTPQEGRAPGTECMHVCKAILSAPSGPKSVQKAINLQKRLQESFDRKVGDDLVNMPREGWQIGELMGLQQHIRSVDSNASPSLDAFQILDAQARLSEEERDNGIKALFNALPGKFLFPAVALNGYEYVVAQCGTLLDGIHEDVHRAVVQKLQSHSSGPPPGFTSESVPSGGQSTDMLAYDSPKQESDAFSSAKHQPPAETEEEPRTQQRGPSAAPGKASPTYADNSQGVAMQDRAGMTRLGEESDNLSELLQRDSGQPGHLPDVAP